ncbi:Cation efflux system protein CzcB [Delftia tsuruhatensis]|uniref:efflux RND transporter periplasmic adaptor subunit n=1 Tax=Delftia tsuruhatensis TaxID=180282 RepID=UPI001E76F050|nr:efflux RND transporter periplasmic adaptor subunit [Delftia tsuruhatensis]CAB5702257.1 Cation efflux system protein CzcB [Delftia tsuruhatensis]CAC9691275.1 Cation efflux system protein CzcB [Delftia tsuruhatensis]
MNPTLPSGRRPRRSLMLAAWPFGGLLISVAMAACNGSTESKADASATPSAPSTHAPQPAPVRRDGNLIVVPEGSPLRERLQVAEIALQPLQTRLSAPATIEAEPEKLVRITPPVAGRLVRLHRQLGDAVRAGDALITMDSSEISGVRAEHAKAQAALLHARQEFDRQKLLFDAEIAARKDYEAAQQALAAAGADARAASDHLAQLGAAVQEGSRGSYVVKSPISGRVVEMAGSQGGYWNDVNASVMTVADLRKVWLSASVSERDLAHVDVGQQAHIALAAYPDLQLEGRVQYVGELVDTATRSVKVRVAVDNPEGRLRPGMFARVGFDAPARQAVMVPAAALLQGQVSTRVFVDKGGWRFEPRDVQVGAQQGGRAEILSGLSAGERVVVNGGVLLQ